MLLCCGSETLDTHVKPMPRTRYSAASADDSTFSPVHPLTSFDPPLFVFVFVFVFITLFPKEMDIMVNKILVEVKAFESRGGSQGAESGEFTYLAAVETAAQFKCPTCGNRVRVL